MIYGYLQPPQNKVLKANDPSVMHLAVGFFMAERE